MLEHRVGLVSIKDCDCPQPEFVDCMKPPHRAPRTTKVDPVTFVNDAGTPLDLFYWNGTCEEIVSWNDVGGVQPFQEKRMRSTHGHTFRARSAATGKLLMQHTLSDIVVRPCDSEDRSLYSPPDSPRTMALKRAAADLAHNNNLLLAEVKRQLSLVLQALPSVAESKLANHSFADTLSSDMTSRLCADRTFGKIQS